MKISSGKTNLYVVITSLEKIIDNSLEYKNINSSIASTKIIDGFYEKLLLSPLVFHVPNNTIVESNSDDDFEKYKDNIFYIEPIYILLLCMNWSSLEQKKFEVSWIVCESNRAVQKTRVFHDVAFLDYHMRRAEGQENTNGRLDYARMDTLFFQKYKKKDLINFLKTPRKYFFFSIFGINPVERKGIYAKQKLLYIDNPNSIKITDKEKKLKYNYHCPICDSEYLIYLNGILKDKANVKKYIKLNGKYIEFLCDHEATDFEGIVPFSFEPKNFVLHTEEQYNQAFLYLFHKASYNNGKIDFYKSETELTSISVEMFNKKRLENA